MPIAKLPKEPIGEKPAPELDGHGDPDPAKLAVVLRLSPPKGGVSVDFVFSLSRSSEPGPDAGSFRSVRRLSNAGGGVVVLDSSREKRDVVAGDTKEATGNGYASLVSRRRLPGRAEVGEVMPYGPGLLIDCDIDGFRWEAPSLGVPSLFVLGAGGLSGELTELVKS